MTTTQDKTRHTGGPWMVQNWNYQDRHRRNVPVIVAKSDAICELYNLWDREQDREQERLANAQLIASAPELLAAVCQLRDYLQTLAGEVQIPSSLYLQGKRAMDAAESALAKAKGGEP